jgi:hypothetical protein
MGDHYIPQYYLRGFTNGNEIWTHDRLEKKSFPSQPKSIANTNKFYSPELERHLANSIEAPAGYAIEKIRTRSLLTDSDREALARYIVTLWQRVPEAKLRFESHIPSVVASVRSEIHEELEAAAKRFPQLFNAAEKRKTEVDKLLTAYKKEKPSRIWHESIKINSDGRLSEVILSMKWHFIKSSGAQFLTSDNPVFFFSHEGLARAASELSIPFSSSIALWATRKENHYPQYFDAKPSATREINRRTAYNATRFVYSAINEKWILPFVCKAERLLNRLT